MKKLKKILGCIKRADDTYNLIDENDHLIVGISGGKDSLTLLYCLHLYRSFSKKKYQLTGIYIDVGYQPFGFEKIEEFFHSFNVEVIKVETQIRKILENNLQHEELNCYLCSRLKKGTLIQAVKDYQGTKLVLGHHGDDAIETILLNLIYGAKIETIPFRRYLDREKITVIRPMLYALEEDIVKASQEISLPIMKSNCPKDGYSKREDIKEMLTDLYQKYPNAHKNILKAIESNPEKIILWQKNKED